MARLAQGDRDARCQPGWRASKWRDDGAVAADDDRVASPVTGTGKALTSGARLPERERARAADGWDRAGSGRGEGSAACGRWAAWAAEGGGGNAGAREREGVWAGNGPTEGGFPFSFSILYLFYIIFF
jgi:hypothetical protein